jgi:hypothetical protein
LLLCQWVSPNIFKLPSKDKLLSAAEDLIGLSNGVFKSAMDVTGINIEIAKRIRSNFGIYIPESES